MNDVCVLFEDINLVVAFLVDVVPEPFQPRRILTSATHEFLARRQQVRYFAVLAASARSVDRGPAVAVGVKVNLLVLELMV